MFGAMMIFIGFDQQWKKTTNSSKKFWAPLFYI